MTAILAAGEYDVVVLDEACISRYFKFFSHRNYLLQVVAVTVIACSLFSIIFLKDGSSVKCNSAIVNIFYAISV